MKNPAVVFFLLIFALFSCEPGQADTFENDTKEEALSQQTEKKILPNSEPSSVAIQASEKNEPKDPSPVNEKVSITQPVENLEPAAARPSQNQSVGETLTDRFDPPAGFERVMQEAGSYGYYLRHLPLKPEGTPVKYYNGGIKPNQGVYTAVVDMEIGTRDLQQCADAIMRLRGEYLWQQQQYEQIHFNFTNGFRVDYDKWRKGYRVQFNGNQTSWKQSAQPSNSYKNFRRYMDLIFAYAGTSSLEKELSKVSLDKLQIGDIFIKGGFPGHAVVVVDVAQHTTSGEKIFMLAQSYMPAQDIQILQNPNDESLSPWYRLPKQGGLYTPEWDFDSPQPRRF